MEGLAAVLAGDPVLDLDLILDRTVPAGAITGGVVVRVGLGSGAKHLARAQAVGALNPHQVSQGSYTGPAEGDPVDPDGEDLGRVAAATAVTGHTAWKLPAVSGFLVGLPNSGNLDLLHRVRPLPMR